jgi:hypothetical protein
MIVPIEGFVRQFLETTVEETKVPVTGSDLARLRFPWCLTMSKSAFGFRHIYPGPLDLVVRRPCSSSLRRGLVGLWGGVVHDPASELPRIPLPRTPVNKALAGAPSPFGWHYSS